MEQFGMTEAHVLALAMSSPAEHFSIPCEVYVGAGGCSGRSCPAEEARSADRPQGEGGPARGGAAGVAASRAAQRLTLDMVHEVMQIAFSWHGYHLHQFETARGAFGRPDEDGDWGFEEVGDESAVALVQVAAEEKAKVAYVYDFGDGWRHDIVVEKITPALPGVAYPRCTGGRGWARKKAAAGSERTTRRPRAAGPVMPFTLAALGALGDLAGPT
jgi:hypothetical protein